MWAVFHQDGFGFTMISRHSTEYDAKNAVKKLPKNNTYRVYLVK